MDKEKGSIYKDGGAFWGMKAEISRETEKHKREGHGDGQGKGTHREEERDKDVG
jgi:hypothetical protein